MGASSAAAQPPDPAWTDSDDQDLELPRGFIEVSGNWGVNLGQRDYLPDEDPGEFKHPFASGFGAGVALGAYVVPGLLSVIADYRFGNTSTREGELRGALTEVQGSLNFHTITAGLRIESRLGRGSVYSEMMVGVLLPYHTRLEFEYAPELEQIGITGEGSREEQFGLALGGQAELGYHFDLGSRMYFGTGLRIAAFQGSNADQETDFENFVTDFTAPMPLTTTIEPSTDGPVRPSTGSVQDIRINLSLGYLF
ncbi:MAG: hypothetical protein H0T79_09960 [Deltaproteobacteria bacterium]|nr:hypothetical protein [Deltaproteobacteria bacterium]